ncbi:PREDICTED: uncharacterized protein LOC102024835 [Chinchilla lanigera]|uniref:uncharacterized protein LOC102024835 n=1 Tax=Chinchilla lanigera TaxID=34839 RepID=UPI00038EE48D|nr:PREDICTED: uncharacterized protein LOC102024835 [Chinchilla lanigera]
MRECAGRGAGEEQETDDGLSLEVTAHSGLLITADWSSHPGCDREELSVARASPSPLVRGSSVLGPGFAAFPTQLLPAPSCDPHASVTRTRHKDLASAHGVPAHLETPGPTQRWPWPCYKPPSGPSGSGGATLGTDDAFEQKPRLLCPVWPRPTPRSRGPGPAEWLPRASAHPWSQLSHGPPESSWPDLLKSTLACCMHMAALPLAEAGWPLLHQIAQLAAAEGRGLRGECSILPCRTPLGPTTVPSSRGRMRTSLEPSSLPPMAAHRWGRSRPLSRSTCFTPCSLLEHGPTCPALELAGSTHQCCSHQLKTSRFLGEQGAEAAGPWGS